MSTVGEGTSPSYRIASFLVSALTDTTIYIQNRYNEHMENARLRAIREAERAEELRRRPADYEEEEEPLDYFGAGFIGIVPGAAWKVNGNAAMEVDSAVNFSTFAFSIIGIDTGSSRAKGTRCVRMEWTITAQYMSIAPGYNNYRMSARDMQDAGGLAIAK
ncbi:predicted protein [Pyrenophora tritici-repentis Pt-1C-BFP]|uniref:Uncharacterized protein n=2 Tax=Pyrenophora tritici-repentis TaxID=45151 RepID=B2W938_PYRTR|nr:uncharacterized protein PTRG_06496 [Pyrenophora tritici-repentis Pt-1C-BFP]EDU49416.1 predicted protein [Pyrenophora tritici-repentis Pt-1C-BFP]